jgi:hypothetical protein
VWRVLRVVQRKRDALKDVVRGHVVLKIQAIQQLESTLELPDLGTEGWNVQLFRSIDSSEHTTRSWATICCTPQLVRVKQLC